MHRTDIVLVKEPISVFMIREVDNLSNLTLCWNDSLRFTFLNKGPDKAALGRHLRALRGKKGRTK